MTTRNWHPFQSRSGRRRRIRRTPSARLLKFESLDRRDLLAGFTIADTEALGLGQSGNDDLPGVATTGTAQPVAVGRFDVNGDGRVTALDALCIISYLNGYDSGLPSPAAAQSSMSVDAFDVSGDGRVSPLDVLSLINRLNVASGGSVASESVNWNGNVAQIVPHEWIVQLRPATDTGTGGIGALSDGTLGVELAMDLQTDGWFLLNLPGLDFASATTLLANHRDVAQFEPNFVNLGAAVPNDPRFDDLWGLSRIEAPAAWDRTTGSPQTVVAVIDSGVDYDHPDLAGKMWTNPGEIPGNGRDDDGNGYVDDVHGYDFVNNDGAPLDDHGHGTHVAGTIAAEANNGIGVTGVCWQTRIMALKFLKPTLDGGATGSTADAIRAIEYATMMKRTYSVNVVVSNNSWGGGAYSAALRSAIDAAGKQGILFVAAAGNDGVNTDLSPHYPAGYDLASIVSVAATDANDRYATFSNYGRTTVDLAAPGVNILSTFPGKRYVSWQGTSMAAPHVSGVAALASALAPTASIEKIKAALLAGVDPLPASAIGTVTNGRLNARRTLEAVAPVVPPPAVPKISISDVSVDEGNLGWTTATVSVRLSAPVSHPVTVAWTTTDGTAVAGEDYQAAQGTLQFGPNETQKTIRIQIVGDLIVEPHEFCLVRLDRPSGATLGQREATVFFANDDTPIAGSKPAVFRQGQWYLDLAGDGGLQERLIPFGLPGDIAVSGDWNGDGLDEPGVVRANPISGGLDWYLNQNPGDAFSYVVRHFGLQGDTPVVGKWFGDGRDHLGVVRNNPVSGGLDWYLNVEPSDPMSYVMRSFGLHGDTPVVGNWFRDGTDHMGVTRQNPASGLVDWYLNQDPGDPMSYVVRSFGLLGFTPVVGDWNQDGRDDVGAIDSNNFWYLDLADDGIFAEKIIRYGLPGDQYLAGYWGGTGAGQAEAADAVLAGGAGFAPAADDFPFDHSLLEEGAVDTLFAG